jgi:hypothetical protein
MAQSFSTARYVAYGNAAINTAGPIRDGFLKDFAFNLGQAGYPSKAEVEGGQLETVTTYRMNNTLESNPGMITAFMMETDSRFNLPSPNAKTAAASIQIKHQEEKTKTGVISIDGPRKGETYESTTAAHDAFKVKNNTKPFKKS